MDIFGKNSQWQNSLLLAKWMEAQSLRLGQAFHGVH